VVDPAGEPVVDVVEESGGSPRPSADAVVHAPANTTSESTAMERRHRVVNPISNPRKALSLAEGAHPGRNTRWQRFLNRRSSAAGYQRRPPRPRMGGR
jgi:hypothetical protein